MSPKEQNNDKIIQIHILAPNIKMPSSYFPKDDDDQAHIQLKLVYALQTAYGYEHIKEILDRLEDVNALFPHDSLRSSFGPDKLRARPLFEVAGCFTRIQHVPLTLFLLWR